jgi:hypothetical protein
MVLRNAYGDASATQLAERIAAAVLEPAAAGVPVSKEDEDRLLGDYEGRPRGLARVARRGTLTLAVPGQAPYALVPLSATRFRLAGAPPGYAVDFQILDGKAARLMIEHGVERPPLEIVPRGTAGGEPEVALDGKELDRLAGVYATEPAAAEVRVERTPGRLRLNVPGQPPYPLRPLSATRFRLEGAPEGYVAEFEVERGEVRAVTVEHGFDRPAVRLGRKK